jgi:N-acetylmuramoyl-L-alanine amidase
MACRLILLYVLSSCLLVPVFDVTAFKVVIDPGNGGKFAGASGVKTHVPEKKLTLLLARRLAHDLKRNGVNVVLTRESDVALDDDLLTDLHKRAAMGDDADIFVSLHLNASDSPKTQGFEVYIPYSESEMPLSSYISAGYMHHHLAHTVKPHWSGTLGNRNDVDGGIRQAKFNVISHTKSRAAVLLELEYLSNPSGEKRMRSKAYQKKLVSSIAKAIIEYRDAKK